MSADISEEWDAVLGHWREVRGRRIVLKKKLVAEGTDMRFIRRRKEYRMLVKEQQRLSTRLRHLNALKSRRLQRNRRVEANDE